MTRGNVQSRHQTDAQFKVMDGLMGLAEKDQLKGFLSDLATLAGVAPDPVRGRPRSERKRWVSYGAHVPGGWRKHADQTTWFWGAALVAALDRAVEGGRHLTVHLAYGCRAPSRKVVRLTCDLLRQSGLSASIQHHHDDRSEIFIRF